MKKNGFTLIEVLIVLGILSILSVIFVEIFFRTLRGGNQAQILGVVKQNGQAALETMDKIIRSSDEVVCPAANSSGDTIVIKKDAGAFRFRFVPPTTLPPTNGFIAQDNVSDCASPLSNAVSLTNQNTTNGASILSGTFSRNSRPSFKDLVTISFNIGPAVQTPKTLTDTLDPVKFNTSVVLR